MIFSYSTSLFDGKIIARLGVKELRVA